MNVAVRPEDATGGPMPEPAGAGHRVGPNAIIQTRHALDHFCGAATGAAIFSAARLGAWIASDPGEMVGAQYVNALNRQIALALPAPVAEAVLRDAGRRTGDYILANRIPKLAQRVLRMLPRRLAQRVLIKAIAANAWTFAGQARIETGANFIAILDNPVCLGRQGFDGCVWHEAVIQRLFEALVDPHALVVETMCTGRGDPACRFVVTSSR